MVKNSFQYGGIVSGPHFADSTDEIKELTREIENKNRIFLASPRRYGKTRRLHQLIKILKKDGMACGYIDLNAFPDLRGFAAAITAMTIRALQSSTDRLLKFFSDFPDYDRY